MRTWGWAGPRPPRRDGPREPCAPPLVGRSPRKLGWAAPRPPRAVHGASWPARPCGHDAIPRPRKDGRPGLSAHRRPDPIRAPQEFLVFWQTQGTAVSLLVGVVQQLTHIDPQAPHRPSQGWEHQKPTVATKVVVSAVARWYLALYPPQGLLGEGALGRPEPNRSGTLPFGARRVCSHRVDPSELGPVRVRGFRKLSAGPSDWPGARPEAVGICAGFPCRWGSLLRRRRGGGAPMRPAFVQFVRIHNKLRNPPPA